MMFDFFIANLELHKPRKLEFDFDFDIYVSEPTSVTQITQFCGTKIKLPYWFRYSLDIKSTWFSVNVIDMCVWFATQNQIVIVEMCVMIHNSHET